ncbi:MAG: hypothetical protein NC299_15495 [Lachnospiraceae bacterium]|nr:hypothetical protein [Lachnospiraceae bacterium]
MKKNIDVRSKARENNVYLYEIAEMLGVSEQTFIRRLRHELADVQKSEIYAAIEMIAERKKLQD